MMYTDGEYASLHPGWHVEHSRWKAEQAIRMLARHGLRPRTVCEVGCGAGAILEAMQLELGADVEFLGYDVSPQAYELARQRAGPRLRVELGDFACSAEPVQDLLLAMDVAEHVEDYLGFLRSLVPRAAMHLFHVPLDLSVVAMLKPSYLAMARQYVGHLHYFTRETAVASIQAAGYEVIDSAITNVELDLGAPGSKRLQVVRRLVARWSPEFAARWLGGFSILVLAKPGQCKGSGKSA